MCGRFESKRLERDAIELFKALGRNVIVEEDINNRAMEDIRPTQKIMTVRFDDDKYKFSNVGWGIKFSDGSPLIFNSRFETIKEKKYWAGLFDKNKCIVPMTAFYEWKTEGKHKTKFRIYLPDEELFFVPAIYHQDKQNNVIASLITTEPNKFIREIHNRMPVILNFEKAVSFLGNTPADNFQLCLPFDDGKKMAKEAV